MQRASDNDANKGVGTGRRPVGESAFGRLERLPPLQLMLYLALLASAALFAVLVVLYLASRAGHPGGVGAHPLPRFFSLSTVVLLGSSFALGQAGRLYRADDLGTLARCLLGTLLLGCVFSGLQVQGWRELHQQGVFFSNPTSPTGTFVYVITGLHVLHVIVGLGWLLAQLLRVGYAGRDAIRTLVFIRNPYQRRQIQLLTTYWHFVDALWVLLFSVFLFT